jgi:flagellar M-ring protein FliF
MALLDAFRNARPARQLAIIALLGVAICAILAALYLAFLRPSYALLYRDLREADAATIVAELERSQVDYRLEDGGRTILVPAGAVDSTRLHIAGRDLPLQGTVGFELFNNSSIGLTEYAQRINLQRALQGELQRTIMAIEGVESARVHLALGEQTPFRGDRRPPRASVAVRTSAGRSLPPTMVLGIQRLVAGSVPDMEASNVVVLNERGVLVSADPASGAGSPAGPERRRIEAFFETRIRRAVEPLLAGAPLEVDVWAGIDESLAAAQMPAPDAQAPLADARNYRLRATVAVSRNLTDGQRSELARAAEEAIGFDAALGDSLTLTASPPAPPAPARDPIAEDAPSDGFAPAPSARKGPQAQAASFLQGLWTPAIILLVAGGLFLVARRRGSGRMTEEDRVAAIAGLRALLAERRRDAPPQA